MGKQNKEKYLSDKQRLQLIEREITEIEIQILNHKKNIESLNEQLKIFKRSILNRIKMRIQGFLYEILKIEGYMEIKIKEKRLENIEISLNSMNSKLVDRHRVKFFFKEKMKGEEILLYDKIIYSPEMREEIAKVQKENQNNMRVPLIKVTEHGVLRYLERVKGLDVNEIKNEMVPKELEEVAKKNGSYEINGLKYIFQDGHTVTVIGLEHKNRTYDIEVVEHRNIGVSGVTVEESQILAWRDCLDFLAINLPEKFSNVYICLEYILPRMDSRRPDVILFLDKEILILEFKMKNTPKKDDVLQTIHYREDILKYHKETWENGYEVDSYLVLTKRASRFVNFIIVVNF